MGENHYSFTDGQGGWGGLLWVFLAGLAAAIAAKLGNDTYEYLKNRDKR